MIPGPINMPTAPLAAALDLFRQYNSAEDYLRQTGVTAPAFDPSKPIKGWADPSPADEGDGSVGYNTLYPVASRADDSAFVHILTFYLSVADAKAVNLMTQADQAQFSGKTLPSVPVPRRALAAGESIRQLAGQFGTGPMPAFYVCNDALCVAKQQQQQADAGAFTVADRQMLTDVWNATKK